MGFDLCTTSNFKEEKMLVLSRKKGQRVMIGRNVEIFVIELRGDRVQLGINAPPEVTVHRKEVYDRIRKERLREPDAWLDTDLQPAVRPRCSTQVSSK